MHFRKAERVQKRGQPRDVGGVVVGLVAPPRALAKTGEVWGNHPVLAGEGARKIHPMVLLRKNAVQQNDGRATAVARRGVWGRAVVQVVDGVHGRIGGFFFQAGQMAIGAEQRLFEQRRCPVVEADRAQYQSRCDRNNDAFQEAFSRGMAACMPGTAASSVNTCSAPGGRGKATENAVKKLVGLGYASTQHTDPGH